MNIKPGHKIYEENFDSKDVYVEYIDSKIKLVENDLEEFIGIGQKDFEYVENSKALEIYEDQIEEVIEKFKNMIDELNELKGALR